MSLPWHEIRDQLARSTSSFRFHHCFEQIRQGAPTVAPFGDPAAMLDTLHRGGVGPERKNAILAALVAAAQGDGPHADSALTLMLLALWPGLDAIRHRSMRRRFGVAAEIGSDLLARATETIRCLDLGRVGRIAATVLRNIERDMIRARHREAQWQGLVGPAGPAEIAVGPGLDDPGRCLTVLHSDLAREIGADALLVLRVVVEGFTQAEAARDFGLTEASGRKRYQRAMARLRENSRFAV